MVLYVRSWYGMGAFYRWVLSTDGSIIFGVLVSRASQKYSTCMVHMRSESIGQESASRGGAYAYCKPEPRLIIIDFFGKKVIINSGQRHQPWWPL